MVSKSKQTSKKMDPREQSKCHTRLKSTERLRQKMSLQEQMAAAAQAAGATTGHRATERLEPTASMADGGTDFRNIVKKKEECFVPEAEFLSVSIEGDAKNLVELLD